MDEAVSSTQNEQANNGGISILPQSSYDVYLSQAEQVAPPTVDLEDPGFQEHVNSLRDTMFYVCQGSCLCGTVNNRGKVIYCYGDLVPRHGELFAEGADQQGSTSSKDLLAAQLGIWTFGIIALLIVLILIRKSISSMRRHLEKMTDRLPYHYDDDMISNHSATSPNMGKDTTMDTMKK